MARKMVHGVHRWSHSTRWLTVRANKITGRLRLFKNFNNRLKRLFKPKSNWLKQLFDSCNRLTGAPAQNRFQALPRPVCDQHETGTNCIRVNVEQEVVQERLHYVKRPHHHLIQKTGKKPEIIRHIQEHMCTTFQWFFYLCTTIYFSRVCVP